MEGLYLLKSKFSNNFDHWYQVRAGAGAHFHIPIVQGVKWDEVGSLPYIHILGGHKMPMF